MQSGPASGPVKTSAPTMFILWGALLFSHFLYAAVAFQLRHGQPPSPAGGPLVVLLTAFAALAGAVSLALYLKQFAGGQLAEWARERKQAGDDRAAAQRALSQKALPVALRSWALSESVTVCGLALSLRGQIPLERFYLYLAGGVSVMLVCRPRGSAIEQAIQDTYRG